MLGAPAEDAFVRFAKRHNIEHDRYGFDDSPIDKFYKLPEFVRFTPDFACVGKQPFLVECKGTGRGNHVSLKEAVIVPLFRWDLICDVYLFFYDSYEKKVCLIALRKLASMLDGYDKGEWVDNGVAKPYFKVPKSDLTWEDDDGEA